MLYVSLIAPLLFMCQRTIAIWLMCKISLVFFNLAMANKWLWISGVNTYYMARTKLPSLGTQQVRQEIMLLQSSYTWIPAPMSSYTISSRFEPLKGFHTQFTQRWNSQPSLRMAPVQEKAMMNYKSALRICKWWFDALRKKWELFDQEQVGRLWMQLFS